MDIRYGEPETEFVTLKTHFIQAVFYIHFDGMRKVLVAIVTLMQNVCGNIIQDHIYSKGFLYVSRCIALYQQYSSIAFKTLL